MLCNFREQSHGRHICQRCGAERPFPVLRNCPARLTLGDWVERAIRPLASPLKRLLGGKVECGCQERQTLLNRLGMRLQRWLGW